MIDKNKNLETAEDLLGLWTKRASRHPHAGHEIGREAGLRDGWLHAREAFASRSSPYGRCSEDPPGRARRDPEDLGQHLLSRFRAALAARRRHRSALGRAVAMHHIAWAPLVQAIAGDKRLSCGLAAFSNWCAAQGIPPEEVDDAVVQRFLSWLENRTLCPKPRDVVRRVPNLWNEASEKIEILAEDQAHRPSPSSLRKRLQWSDLSESFRRDARSLSRHARRAGSVRRAAECAATALGRKHPPPAE